jgi:monofunctional biosynthetic peptidoglycan transglycosylase
MKNLFRILVAFFGSILLLFIFSLMVIYFSVPDVEVLKKENPSTTSFIEFRKKEARKQGKKLKIQQRWVRLRDVPEILRKSIIVGEDASFWIHQGIDWYEVKQSIKKNWEEGEIARGGSTITQQLAKNLYLTPEKTIYRKMREWFIAKELERTLTKSRILELYLNTIELGRGVFGIRSAAQQYFHKQPWQLELWEMVRLAAIIPSPLNIQPNYPSRGLRWRSRVILRRLYKFNFINEEEYHQATEKLEGFFNT